MPARTSTPQQLARRREAAFLLASVLEGTLEPRQAINRWPVLCAKEGTDTSLETAYHILWYLEADEDQQRQPFYLDLQVELLTQVIRWLDRGDDLPRYLQQTYLARPPVYFYQSQNTWQLPWQGLFHVYLQLRQDIDAWLSQLPFFHNRGENPVGVFEGGLFFPLADRAQGTEGSTSVVKNPGFRQLLRQLVNGV